MTFQGKNLILTIVNEKELYFRFRFDSAIGMKKRKT